MNDSNTAIELSTERERLAIERERLELDKLRAKQDNRFVNRYIAALVSLAAVLVTAGQIWVQYISKDREISLNQIQAQAQLEQLTVQQERSWKLELTRFVSENRSAIFGEDNEERRRIRDLMLVTFPSDITNALFRRLEQAAPDEQQRQIWQAGLDIQPKVRSEIASGQKDALGRQYYDYYLWLEIPQTQKSNVLEVMYEFNHPSFGSDNKKTSRDPATGFQVSYRGWGSISSVTATIYFKDGSKSLINFDMAEVMRASQ